MRAAPDRGGDQSAGWRAGDVAECIDTRDLQTGGHRPHVAQGGRYLKLHARYAVLGAIGEPGAEMVLLLGLPSGPKLARRFRKVPPPGEARAVEREVEYA